MTKRKNVWAKLMALFALFGILVWIIWTWVLIIFELYFQDNTQIEQELTQEQLEELLKAYSGSLTWTWEEIE